MQNQPSRIGRSRIQLFMFVDEPDLAALSLDVAVGVTPARNVGDRQEPKGAFVPVGFAVAASSNPQVNFGGADGVYSGAILAEYDPAGGKVYPLLKLGQRDTRTLPWIVGKNVELLADPTKPSQGVVIRGNLMGEKGYDAHVYIAGVSNKGPGSPIILHHETPGAPKNSTLAYEGDGSRPTELSDALRIGAGVDVLCQPVTASSRPTGPDWVYFNGTKHGGAKFSGYLATRFAAADAMLSHETGGPLRESSSLHDYAYTRDGRYLRRGALSISYHLWTDGNPRYDAPLWIEQVDEPENVQEPQGHPMRCHIQLDRDAYHPHLCKPGRLNGMFKVHKKEPMVELPPCEGARQTVPGGGDIPQKTAPAAVSAYYAGELLINGLSFISHPDA